MSKKLIIILIVLGVIVAGVFILKTKQGMRGGTEESSNVEHGTIFRVENATGSLGQTENRGPKEFIIRIYGDNDYRPASLTIYVGDTVTFINEDSRLHWPGADPHPTHSSLPTFDALGGISHGQRYSHTFSTEGMFGYHEHLLDNPPTLGVITVLK